MYGSLLGRQRMSAAPRVGARSVVEFCAIFVLYSVVTAIFFWQLLPFLSSSLIGPAEDNMQDFWNTWYSAAAERGESFFYTNLIKFPEGMSLYYHSFAYPKIFASWLITRIVEAKIPTLILLQNLSVLASFPLASVGAFYVVRNFVSDCRAALLGGFIFAFNPSHIAHAMHHVHVSSIEFIPFFVVSYLLAARKKSVLWVVLAICFYCLSALSCWYYLFYIGYFMLFQTVYLLYTMPKERKWIVLLPMLTFVGTIVGLSPLLLPMIGEVIAGANVYLPGGHNVADVLAYVSFPPTHLLSELTERVYSRLTGNPWESTVYLGLVNLALLAWALFYISKKRPQMFWEKRLFIYVVSGMAVFGVLASGASLHILGHSTIPMPDRWLDQLPISRNIRTSSRAIVFVYLFLALGIGQAYMLMLRQGNAIRIRRLMALGVAGLMVLDFYPAHLSATALLCSPGFSMIREDPQQSLGILTLPDGYVSNNKAMMQQFCHGRPIVGGNVAREVTRTLRNHLVTADLELQREELVANRIKYIVMMNVAKDRLFEWGDISIKDYFILYPTLYEDNDIVILQVY
jgi:hypothetical protein